jgi:CheY-like chemotaxis protein/HPt (histidine-containing phosphotransfer) domain-containing protein
VLDLSEIEAERVELQSVACNLRRIASACLDLVRPTAEAKRIALDLRIAPDVPSHVTTDPTRLRQVLLNLLGNAVKFTASGAIHLNLRLTADGARLRADVADTGPGIPPADRHRLFQDFGRLDSDSAGAVEGAGLGLAISSRLAKLMGGALGHRDNPGGGSVFWLELPLGGGTAATPADAVLPFSDLLDAELPPQVDGLLNVLVVDDVAMNRDIAAAFIRSAGHAVTCAEGGAEAVALAAVVDFDVVMMDVRMPAMDGLESTRRIRSMDSARGQVPVIAMTAQAFALQIAECREAGMDGHLAKPFTLASMLAALAGAVIAGRRRGVGLAQTKLSEPHGHAAQDHALKTPAQPPRTPSAAPTEDVPLGADLPVFDRASFARTAAFLAPEAVAEHMRTLTGRSERLLGGLNVSGGLADSGGALAEAAHVLAGSAGMFGFERLVVVARHFERAVTTGAVETDALADALGDVIVASLSDMRRCLTTAGMG